MDPTLDEFKSLVDRSLDRYLPKESAWPERVHAAMRYSIFAGGKRIRPLLCLAAAHAAGGATGRERALSFACAVELIHTFSLIHDDLPSMDDDDLRRGRPTCHKAFDEATAILAGDALQTLAFEIIATDAGGVDRPALVLEALTVLARACGTAGLIGGQMDDLKYEGIPATPQDLERIHRTKTGALIVATVVGGGLLAGGPPDRITALRAFAEPIGLAFQIVDDILDVEGDAAALGKTAGKDAAHDKPTYTSLFGLDGARRMAGECATRAHATLVEAGLTDSWLDAIADWVISRHN